MSDMWLPGEATMSLTSPKKSFKPDPRLPNPEDITAGHITDVVHLEKVLKQFVQSHQVSPHQHVLGV